MEEFTIASDEYRLRGWLQMPQKGQAPFPCTLLCHGIPSGRPPDANDPGYPALMEKIAGRGIASIHFNFRGTGESEGDFSFGGWLRDLEAIADALLYGDETFGDMDAGRLAVLAFSGGAAVSVDCAARHHRFSALACMSSPADLTELIPRENLAEFLDHWRSIGIIRDTAFPPDADRFYREVEELSPLRHIGAVAPTPVLIVHGESDGIVPVQAAHELYEEAAEPKELRVLPGAGHRLRLVPEAMEGALDWLQAHLADSGA